MGRITSSVGLVSGINSADIIDQLMKLEERPKTLLQDRIETANEQKLAFTDISTRLTSLRITSSTFKRASTFEGAATSSSNEDVLTATAANGAAIGSFQFQIARLVTSQQTVSKGFAATTAKMKAGTITIEQGGGELSSQTPLAQLNGGAGVRRGMFRITDRSGKTAVIDTTASVTVDDVIKKINTSLEIGVRASVKGDQLMLTDQTGQAGALSVQDLGDGQAAADLGLLTDTDGLATTITGGDINYLGNLTALAQLNDGRGVRTSAASADFTVTFADSSTVSVTLGDDAKTLGAALEKINAASPTKLKAELVPGGNSIKLTDLTGGGTFSVADAAGSKAATDLGIVTAGSAGTVTGSPVIAGMNTVLLSSLNGGAGIALTTIDITGRNGGNATIDLSTAKTVQDVLDAISNASGANVTAKLKSSGNGIQLVDDSGGTGNLVIAAGATADALGLTGTFATTVTAVEGKNLQRQWVSENTMLSTYNGGKGVPAGKFKIVNSNGIETTIDLTKDGITTIGDVMSEINTRVATAGVTASINPNGDGLLLTDASTGVLKMKVEDVEGTSASDLKIKGEADAVTKQINGTFEKTVDILATDTLADLQTKINNLGFAVGATVINDGTGATPYRLSLNARNTGRAGRVTFDAGATGLDTSTLVDSQDAAVFLGGEGAAQPLLVTSSTNQLTGVVKGVTIDLHGVSSSPVTLNVTRSTDALIESIGKFAESFNDMITKIRELTKFDTETNERGLLLGDASIQRVESEVYAMLRTVVPNAGRYKILQEIGLRVAVDANDPKAGTKLEFDEEKFRAAFATDPDAVKALFTTAQNGLGSTTLLDQLNSGRGVRRAPTGADFQAKLADGTTLDVSLAGAETLGDVINAINATDNTKIKAELTSTGSLRVTDLTTGVTPFGLSAMNGSQALIDLGLSGAAVGTVSNGASLGTVGDPRNRGGGMGYAFEARINSLIDPVSGVIPRENRSLDEKALQFQDRIENLDKVLTGKRERLQRQFANLETVLAGLQNQQQAIGQIQTIQMPDRR
ncbi:MAG: flagellar filament capping protein FliD [Planctomycetota bacterium]|nr:flagellar filament capping protein FliD [Planctomycetota bacterium]